MTDHGALTRPETLDLRASALFLDLDGTLAAIAPRPEDVGPDPKRSVLLRDLGRRLDGRLAVISGRTIAEVDRILDGAVVSVAGVHGLERRWPDGRLERPDPDPGLKAAWDDLAPLVRRFPALLIEDKGLALGVHYRAAPEAEQAVREATQLIAGKTGLVIQTGEKVVELRGLARARAMRSAPSCGSRPLPAPGRCSWATT